MSRNWSIATRGSGGGKWVPGTQQGSIERIEAHGQSREMAMEEEEEAGNWQFLPEPGSLCDRGGVSLKMHGDY